MLHARPMVTGVSGLTRDMMGIMPKLVLAYKLPIAADASKVLIANGLSEFSLLELTQQLKPHQACRERSNPLCARLLCARCHACCMPVACLLHACCMSAF